MRPKGKLDSGHQTKVRKILDTVYRHFQEMATSEDLPEYYAECRRSSAER